MMSICEAIRNDVVGGEKVQVALDKVTCKWIPEINCSQVKKDFPEKLYAPLVKFCEAFNWEIWEFVESCLDVWDTAGLPAVIWNGPITKDKMYAMNTWFAQVRKKKQLFFLHVP